MSGPEQIRGGGELFKYPWTAYSKVQQFPFKFYWTHSRVFRYFFITSGLLLPVMIKMTKAVNSPANVRHWDKVRADKHHTFFDLPHD